ncbi:MAG: hypothetical protein FWC87_00120 [Acidimicrobiaceae bacterium]|nr:hypothetical protein [Acidimicrobiaceae bacterium]
MTDPLAEIEFEGTPEQETALLDVMKAAVEVDEMTSVVGPMDSRIAQPLRRLHAALHGLREAVRAAPPPS